MASSFPSFCSVMAPSLKRNAPRFLQVRAQSFRDEGRSRNNVDANLSVLRERIEEVRMKERLERCCRSLNGWNTVAPGYNYKCRRAMELSEFFELFGLVGRNICLTILCGTFFICLLSILVHLNQ